MLLHKHIEHQTTQTKPNAVVTKLGWSWNWCSFSFSLPNIRGSCHKSKFMVDGHISPISQWRIESLQGYARHWCMSWSCKLSHGECRQRDIVGKKKALETKVKRQTLKFTWKSSVAQVADEEQKIQRPKKANFKYPKLKQSQIGGIRKTPEPTQSIPHSAVVLCGEKNSQIDAANTQPITCGVLKSEKNR